MRPVGVLDTRGLLNLFRQVEGRTLVGAVDGVGIVELVYSGERGGNLVCIFTDDGRNTGLVSLGSVANPADYCRREAA